MVQKTPRLCQTLPGLGLWVGTKTPKKTQVLGTQRLLSVVEMSPLKKLCTTASWPENAQEKGGASEAGAAGAYQGGNQRPRSDLYKGAEEMTISKKQLEANRKNAQKGGVKTPEGRAIVKYNALKHGLLANEAVVTVGEGAENPDEFNGLLADLKAQLKPEGTLEEMLVEKIAAAYWRLRRAYTYEVGLIRKRLDTATDDFYRKKNWEGQPRNETDQQIDEEIKQSVEEMKGWEKCAKRLSQMHNSGKPLDDTFEMEDLWDWLHEKYSYLLPRDANGEATLFPPDELREFLNKNACWNDSYIWEILIGVCEGKIKEHGNEIKGLEKQKEKNRLKLQVIKKLGSIPSKDELDRLLRYEGAIERQFYKALNQLERLQRLRTGDNVPAPVEVDVDVNTGGDR